MFAIYTTDRTASTWTTYHQYCTNRFTGPKASSDRISRPERCFTRNDDCYLQHSSRKLGLQCSLQRPKHRPALICALASKKTMGIESRVGNFFFRSRFSEWLWNFSTSSPFQVIRIIGAVLISVLLVARAANLFLYTKYASYCATPRGSSPSQRSWPLHDARFACIADLLAFQAQTSKQELDRP